MKLQKSSLSLITNNDKLSFMSKLKKIYLSVISELTQQNSVLVAVIYDLLVLVNWAHTLTCKKRKFFKLVYIFIYIFKNNFLHKKLLFFIFAFFEPIALATDMDHIFLQRVKLPAEINTNKFLRHKLRSYKESWAK